MNDKARINKITDIVDSKGESKLIIILRHSDREEMTNVLRSYEVPLTDQGRKLAHELGMNLSSSYSYRLLHSHVSRCMNTALQITEGIKVNGGSVKIVGERDYLGGFFIKNSENVLGLANQIYGPEFIHHWSEGDIKENDIIPFDNASKFMLESIIKEANRAEQSEIDIHITHDWNMMLILYNLFNFKENNLSWPYYLEPIFIVLNNSNNLLLYENVERKLEIKI